LLLLLLLLLCVCVLFFERKAVCVYQSCTRFDFAILRLQRHTSPADDERVTHLRLKRKLDAKLDAFATLRALRATVSLYGKITERTKACAENH